jgi:hypothetical protein
MTGTRRVNITAIHLIILLAFMGAFSCPVLGKTVATWDFTKGLQGWQGNKDVPDLTVSPEGLVFETTGIDPWLEGPAVEMPGAGLTRVRVRMKSQAEPHAELFYGRVFQAGRSVRFTVQNDGQWHEYSLFIREPLGPGTRFRLDPAAGTGRVVVGSIQIEALPPVQAPPFAPPERPTRGTAEPASLESGDLVIEHYRGGWGDYVVKVADREMAAGYGGEMIGVLLNGQSQWLKLREGNVTWRAASGEILCQTVVRDSGGARWQVKRRFQSRPKVGTISVQTVCLVDQDREVIHIPWLTLFPGLGTFGQRKTQGLFAGLEYLEDEPSSSMADITTAEHVRRVPDPVKITLPLMAIAHDDRCLGLMWEPSNMVAAVFDSPDRVYGSSAHVLALAAPGVGDCRFENDMVAHTPFTLKANEPLAMRAIIVGSRGKTVMPAVQRYVELRGLPDVPPFGGGFEAAVTLLAHGWLDSAVNEAGLFRHAVWGESFRATPAADALMYMDWLASHARDPNLVARLEKGRDLGLTKIPLGQPYTGTVSHTRTPTAPFLFGSIETYVEQRRAEALGLLKGFDEQGIKLYRPGKVDYSKTHFAKHANGLAAADVARILEAATMAADPQLLEQGLSLLDKQTALYANTVPRGAQTWEVPLHTPDILACAHLVQAYTLGYIISRKPEYLEQARYWAWTGVPFVYLTHPTEGEIGPYATIAVLGATNWQAPVWLGLPVQWCGLVYSSALHFLSRYDKGGPWEEIAKGITAAGLRMTWPASDQKRQGLLPDVFDLRGQRRDGPAINPGTVQARVPELFDKGTLYDVSRLPNRGWFIHAPCPIRDLRETPGSVTFTVDGWGDKTFRVLLSGVKEPPAQIEARPIGSERTKQVAPDRTTVHHDARQRLLVVTLAGPSEVDMHGAQ